MSWLNISFGIASKHGELGTRPLASCLNYVRSKPVIMIASIETKPSLGKGFLRSFLGCHDHLMYKEYDESHLELDNIWPQVALVLGIFVVFMVVWGLPLVGGLSSVWLLLLGSLCFLHVNVVRQMGSASP